MVNDLSGYKDLAGVLSECHVRRKKYNIAIIYFIEHFMKNKQRQWAENMDGNSDKDDWCINFLFYFVRL